MDKDWKIDLQRHPSGRIERMTLIEGGPAPAQSGPLKIVRALRFEREGEFWRVSITGPRGGLQLDGVFSGEALEEIAAHLAKEAVR